MFFEGTKISIPLGRLIQTPAGQQILLRTTAANQATLSQTIVQQSQLSSNANTRQFILTRSPHIPTGKCLNNYFEIFYTKFSVE